VVHERDVSAGVTQLERHPQRVEHQRGACERTTIRAVHVDHEAEAQDALPAAQVRAPTARSVRSAVKSRLTRSGRLSAPGSALVVRHDFPAPLGAMGHHPLYLAARDVLAGARVPFTSPDTRTRSSCAHAPRGKQPLILLPTPMIAHR
jgi:hypothetical protein